MNEEDSLLLYLLAVVAVWIKKKRKIFVDYEIIVIC